MGSSNRLTQFFVIVFALYVLLGAHFFMHNPGGSGLSLPFNMVGWIFVAILIATGLWLVTQQGALRLSHSHLLLWAGGLLLICALLAWRACRARVRRRSDLSLARHLLKKQR